MRGSGGVGHHGGNCRIGKPQEGLGWIFDTFIESFGGLQAVPTEASRSQCVDEVIFEVVSIWRLRNYIRFYIWSQIVRQVLHSSSIRGVFCNIDYLYINSVFSHCLECA